MIDLNILYKKPDLNKTVKLEIIPLAPLSMVSDIPGTYYKTLDCPNQHMICGLIENIIGWHFDKKDREAILKKIKTVNKKNKEESKLEKSNSGYQPLVNNLFNLGLVMKSKSFKYNDLWKKSFSRTDADVHPKGSIHLDYEALKTKVIALKSQNLLQFFKSNVNNYPLYYSSPTVREYVVHDSPITMRIEIDEDLLILIEKALINNSTASLGTSEGWVEVKIERI
jgi:CRISPR-associated protein Cas5